MCVLDLALLEHALGDQQLRPGHIVRIAAECLLFGQPGIGQGLAVALVLQVDPG